MSNISLHPVYLSARAAIIAPERAVSVTQYSALKWLPRLGPERWCLVILLRSLCIDSQRRNDGTKRVAISWRELAEKLDVHEETIASWMKHERIPNDKPWRRVIPTDEKSENLALFIPRLRYAYETRNGKTRRIGFLLEVLMEDPVVPEDETRLHQQVELMQMQQGELGLETYRLTDQVNDEQSDLRATEHKQRILDLHNVNQVGVGLPQPPNPTELDLRNEEVNPGKSDLSGNVKQQNTSSVSYVNQPNPELLDHKSDISGKNVHELDSLIQQLKHRNIKKNLRREVFDPIVRLTEELLDDKHSTGMLLKVLNVLHPERLDLYVAAVRVGLEAAKTNPQVNRGAVFVRALRDFTKVAGIDLGLKSSSTDREEELALGNPGSHSPDPLTSPLAAPSVTEAIWTETQLILRRQMTQATYNAIVQGTTLLKTENDRYIIGVQTDMAKQWLENRLYTVVQRALSTVVGKGVVIEFIQMDEAA